MSELWKLSASDISDLARSGQVSCQEVVHSVLDRIEKANPAINAIMDNMADEAIKTAWQLDNTPDRHDLPLLGVPVTIKDTINVLGRPVTRGTYSLSSNTSQQDSPVVANLRRAGAIIVGRTNTSALGMRWLTENAAYGITRNPHNLNLSPMGSSGGAAAATAAGMCALAHGSDSWGSVRLPAWACGVVGLKPTVGTIPNHTLNNQETVPAPRPYITQLCTTEGVLARRVRDCQLAFEVFKQNGYCDPHWIPPVAGLPVKKTLRVAMADYGQHLASAGTRQALDQVRVWLIDHGHVVENIEIAHSKSMAQTYAQAILGLFTGYRSLLETVITQDPVTLKMIDWYQDVMDKYGAVDSRFVMNQRHQYQIQMAHLFMQYDLLITPVCLRDQYAISTDSQSLESFISIMESAETQSVTSFLNLPAMSLPVLLYDKLPVSVQLVSAPHCESRIFQAALDIETHARYSGWNNLAV